VRFCAIENTRRSRDGAYSEVGVERIAESDCCSRRRACSVRWMRKPWRGLPGSAAMAGASRAGQEAPPVGVA